MLAPLNLSTSDKLKEIYVSPAKIIKPRRYGSRTNENAKNAEFFIIICKYLIKNKLRCSSPEFLS